MTTILFPTDFSNNAAHALKFALEIAKASKAKLILFNAFWVPVYEFDTPAEISSKENGPKKESLKELKHIQQEISASYGEVHAEILAMNGFTADAIVEASREKRVDLIIMGTKGATGLKEIIMGSNTVDVINKSTIPVLTVPKEAVEFNLSRLAFATDFHDDDKEKIEFLINLGALFHAEITVLHVTEDDFILETADKAILQRLKKDVKAEMHYVKLKYKLLKGNVIEELQNYLDESQTNLLALVTTKRHFFSKIFEKSITQKMAFHARIPLLVLHAN